jgi:hypothetical protein
MVRVWSNMSPNLPFTDGAQISAAVAALSTFVSTAVAVTPMAVRGADFVNSVDGSRFQIIGVA